MTRPLWAPSLPILVVGDFCTDVLLRANASRLSREHPVPVLDLEDIVHQTGCAGNIVRQLAAYGVETRLVTLAHAIKLRGLCGVPEHEAFRLDGPWETESDRVRAQRFEALAHTSFAAAIYADYRGVRGPVPDERAFLMALGCPLIADARHSLGGWRGFAVVKANSGEVGVSLEASGRLAHAQRRLAEGQYLILTSGARGHALVARDRVEYFPAVDLPGPVLNTSGAGDVFTATLAVLLAADWERCGNNPSAELVHEASKTAALAAGLRIRKPGYNEAVTWEEIEGCGRLAPRCKSATLTPQASS